MAVQIPVPRGSSYLMPVGSIMRLFKKYNGQQAVKVASAPPSLDIAAARTGNKVYLHVLNLEYSRAVEVSLQVASKEIKSARVFEIAPENLRQAVNQDQPHVFEPQEKIGAAGKPAQWRFPAGSVSAVELELV